MNYLKKINYTKAIHMLFFVIYFIVGCFIFNDYGVGWDEEAQHNIGAIMYEYASTKDSTKLFVEQQYQYHGSAWELFNYIIEVKLDKREFREYVLLKHFNNWFLFYTATIFFFFLAKKTTKNTWLALVGTAMLITSPRIFAESFYNSKDVVSLSLYIIAMYTMLRLLDKPTVLKAFLHAVVCGFLIDVRITGILIPFLTLFFFTLNAFANKNHKLKQWLIIALFIFLAIIFTVLFWPVLWIDPIKHFVAALQMMGKYQWGENVFYLGRFILPSNLPWHYVPVWITITTPLLCLVGFLYAVLMIVKNAIKNPIEFYKIHYNLFVFLACFFAPVIAVIVFKSILYDGWRHLYFTYPALLLICIWGISHFYKRNQNSFLKRMLSGLIAVHFIYIGMGMFIYHPFQNTYFNVIANKAFDIKQNFEMDYWGLSYKQGIEKMIEREKGDTIKYSASNFPGYINRFTIQTNKQFFFLDTNDNDAAYFISNYRWHPADYNYNKVDSIVSYGNEILGIYKLKN